MAIDRGYGIATSSVIADSYDLDALIADTEAAKVAALAAQVAAELAETNAETAETNAETAETNAETAETNAETAETNAAASATTAATQAALATTNGAAQVTLATAQVALATTKATAAATSATAAETAETNAETAETNAETAQAAAEAALDTFDDRFLGSKASDPTVDNDGNALLEGAMYYNTTANDIRFYNGSSWDAPATDAATSATAAASSASSASTAKTAAETAETNAETAETNAETAETNAETAQTAAETAKTAAETAKTAAETAKTAAETAETNAETAETNAETAETNAASSATAAAASAAAAAASADSFDDTYLGAKSSDPTLDNDGDALTEGDMYFNTSTDRMKVYDGSSWDNVAVDSATVVTKTSATGSGALPAGTTAQRDGSPSAGYIRWNTTDTSAEIYDGSGWTAVGGGNTTDKGLYEHEHTIDADYSITSGNNAMSAGPITISSGYSVTVPTGSTWVIV